VKEAEWSFAESPAQLAQLYLCLGPMPRLAFQRHPFQRHISKSRAIFPAEREDYFRQRTASDWKWLDQQENYSFLESALLWYSFGCCTESSHRCFDCL
jgi:hypothetical protein